MRDPQCRAWGVLTGSEGGSEVKVFGVLGFRVYIQPPLGVFCCSAILKV